MYNRAYVRNSRRKSTSHHYVPRPNWLCASFSAHIKNLRIVCRIATAW